MKESVGTIKLVASSWNDSICFNWIAKRPWLCECEQKFGSAPAPSSASRPHTTRKEL